MSECKRCGRTDICPQCLPRSPVARVRLTPDPKGPLVMERCDAKRTSKWVVDLPEDFVARYIAWQEQGWTLTSQLADLRRTA